MQIYYGAIKCMIKGEGHKFLYKIYRLPTSNTIRI